MKYPLMLRTGKRIGLLLLPLLLLAGCGASVLYVQTPVPQDTPRPSVRAFQFNIEDYVQSEHSAPAIGSLGEELVLQGERSGWQAAPADDSASSALQVSIKITGFDGGNRLSRALFGGDLGGKGQARIEVEFALEGQPAGVIRVDAEMTDGFFGGSMRTAMRSAAKEVVSFIDRNFG